MKTTRISIPKAGECGYKNQTRFCVGTGRMDLALHQEYIDELKQVQSLCHFSHIRGHGLFSRQMGIYQKHTAADGKVTVSYNFTYLDRVMDMYTRNGLEPFIELGFMPDQLASDTNTVFWWHGNITPPSDENEWIRLVKSTLEHLIARYGRNRVVTWPVEVWNEPNLVNFWKNKDKPAYMRLYEITALAVKEVDPRFRVGGPAICGGDGSLEWVRDFLTFCRDKKLPVDFVTRHAYMGENPERRGRYLYHTMCSVDEAMVPLTDTREIIDSFPEYAGMEMHITEFNTSYNSRCAIHDTNANAAIIAHWLSRLPDVAASYSYWTFGDVFEEEGIPLTPFHGGFGLTAGGCIPKPTLWTFAFYSKLSGVPVWRDDHCVITKEADGSLAGIAWNDTNEPVSLEIESGFEKAAVVELSQVNPLTTNPLKCWHDMGEPSSLNDAQLEFLKDAGRPFNTTHPLNAGDVFSLDLCKDAIAYFRIAQTETTSDLGYDYDWYISGAGSERK